MIHAPWHRLVAAAASKHMWIKSLGTMLLIAVFFGAYFYLLKRPAYPPKAMPITWVDRLVPFQPWTLALYISLWVYVSLPPVLLPTRHELSRYALAIAGV